jgi:peptide/nickel transport system substrate-binding protein
MRRSIASEWFLALSGLVLIALVLGCGDDKKSSGAGSSGKASSCETTAASGFIGNRLIIGLEYSGEETKDFRIAGGGAQAWLHRPHLETLLTKDCESGDAAPRLAEAWEMTPDGRSIRFRIRKGVQFHDGWGEMTAEDVAWNYNVHLKSEPAASSINGRVERVDVVGPYEIVMHLVQPGSDMLDWIATDMYSTAGIVSKRHWESVGDPKTLRDPMLAGTGPWKLTEWVAGRHIRFERVENHWRKTPSFKQLEYRIINETSTRLAALLAGEIHITPLPTDLMDVAVGRGMQVATGNLPANRVWMEFWGCCVRDIHTGEYRHPNSPLMDVRVRKALSKAVDRHALNKAFLGGTGELAILPHMHPSREGWDPSWKERWEREYGYDPEAARALLAQAGYGPNRPLQTNMILSYQTGFPEGPDVQEAIIGYWKAVGVDAKLLTVDRATERRVSEAFQYDNHLFMVTSASGAVDGYAIRNINNPANLRSDPNFKGNFRGVNLPEMEKVILQALAEPRVDRYEALAKQMGELAFTNHVSYPLFWLPTSFAVNPKVVDGWTFSGAHSGFWSHLEYANATKN